MITNQIRQIAGLTLKTQIQKNFPRIGTETINYIKDKLLAAFYDPVYEIRKTVSSVISMIIVRGGLAIWPQIMKFLSENLEHSPDQSVV